MGLLESPKEYRDYGSLLFDIFRLVQAGSKSKMYDFFFCGHSRKFKTISRLKCDSHIMYVPCTFNCSIVGILLILERQNVSHFETQ